MILQEALHCIDIEKFQQILDAHRVSAREQDLYRSFIELLKQKIPVPSKHRLVGGLRRYDYGNGEWEELEAFLVHEGENVEYALDFIPLEECLGYQMDEISIKTHGLEEFLFAILYDMTFDGFEERTKSKVIKDMTERVEDIESDSSEKKAFNSLEEVFNALDKMDKKEK